MTLPTDLKPQFVVRSIETPSFWSLLHDVAAKLRLNGFPSEAVEFRRRAMELNQNTDEDLTDLLALVQEYVRMDD